MCTPYYCSNDINISTIYLPVSLLGVAGFLYIHSEVLFHHQHSETLEVSVVYLCIYASCMYTKEVEQD